MTPPRLPKPPIITRITICDDSAKVKLVGSIADNTLFGELAIDLQAAGIFQAGTCESFSSAYLKSRSSDSFTAALKDFIAPAPLNLASCGAIKVTKTRKHAADGAGQHPQAGVTHDSAFPCPILVSGPIASLSP